MNENFSTNLEEEEAYFNKLAETILNTIFEECVQELPLPKILCEEKEIGHLGDLLTIETEKEDWPIPIYAESETYLYYYIDLKPLKLKIGEGMLKNMSEEELNNIINETVEAHIEIDEHRNLTHAITSFKIDPKLSLFLKNKNDIEKAIEITIIETIEKINTNVFLLTKAVNLLMQKEKLRCIKPREEEIEKAVEKLKEKIKGKVVRKMKSWKKKIERRKRKKKEMLQGIKYYDESHEHLHKGNFKLALECLEKALKLNPYYKTYPTYWGIKGYALQQLGKHEEAIKCFNKRIKLEKQWNTYTLGVRYDKAISLIALGKRKEAIKLLEEVASKSSSIFGAYKQTLLTYYNLILKKEPNNKEIQGKRRKLLKTIQFKCPQCKTYQTEATEIQEKPEQYIINMKCKNCGHKWTKTQTKNINLKTSTKNPTEH